MVDEMSSHFGRQLERPHSFKREAALTRAVMLTGQLRAATNAVIAREDADLAADE